MIGLDHWTLIIVNFCKLQYQRCQTLTQRLNKWNFGKSDFLASAPTWHAYHTIRLAHRNPQRFVNLSDYKHMMRDSDEKRDRIIHYLMSKFGFNRCKSEYDLRIVQNMITNNLSYLRCRWIECRRVSHEVQPKLRVSSVLGWRRVAIQPSHSSREWPGIF